jgi:hypothetical protein
MTKAELENKHLGELHSLAAAAGVERYRMLSRAELIAKLADGESGSGRPSAPSRERSSSRDSSPRGEGERGDRPPRRRRRRSGASAESGEESRPSGREPRGPRRPERAPEPPAAPAPPPPAAAPAESSSRPKRRRRRRFGRRGKQEGVTLQGLLLPPEAGRQALLCAETRAACTALLRGIAADLSDEANGGPDPVALLIDPSPEELADWRRDAPKARPAPAPPPATT